MKLKMAVVGKDVSKSLSSKMHTFILNKLSIECTYDKVSIDIDEFDKKFPKVLKEYDTLNVTIPYKLSCIPYLDNVLDDASTFGAVNTIDARIKSGYNTDGMGFMLMLENNNILVENKNILVLGSGGVGRSVIKKLIDANANVFAYDLNKEGLLNVYKVFNGFTPLDEIENKPYDVIINCTGVGMHKTEGKSPLSEDLIKLCKAAVDLIYEPKVSEFLRLALVNGKTICNGEAMLFYQAYYADCYFLGLKKNAKLAKELFEEYQKLAK
jgi:shikimate dehydrogenase